MHFSTTVISRLPSEPGLPLHLCQWLDLVWGSSLLICQLFLVLHILILGAFTKGLQTPVSTLSVSLVAFLLKEGERQFSVRARSLDSQRVWEKPVEHTCYLYFNFCVNFVSCDKMSWEKQMRGERGFFGSQSGSPPSTAGISRQLDLEAACHANPQAKADSNEQMLACLRSALLLHSHVIQDPLHREWISPTVGEYSRLR